MSKCKNDLYNSNFNRNKKNFLCFNLSDDSENSDFNDYDNIKCIFKSFSVNRFVIPKSPNKYINYTDYKIKLEQSKDKIKNINIDDENFKNKKLKTFSNENGNYTKLSYPNSEKGKIKKKLFLKINEIKKEEKLNNINSQNINHIIKEEIVEDRITPFDISLINNKNKKIKNSENQSEFKKINIQKNKRIINNEKKNLKILKDKIINKQEDNKSINDTTEDYIIIKDNENEEITQKPLLTEKIYSRNDKQNSINENEKKTKINNKKINPINLNIIEQLQQEKKISFFDTQDSFNLQNKKNEEEEKNISNNNSYIIKEEEEEISKKINNKKLQTIESDNYENLENLNNEHNIPLRNNKKFFLFDDLFLKNGNLSGVTLEQQSVHTFDSSIVINDELLSGWTIYNIYFFHHMNYYRKKFIYLFNYWKKISRIQN